MTVEWVTIGQILKPHGYQGEVKVFPLTDDPNRFGGLVHESVWLELPNGRRQETRIEHARRHLNAQLVQFEGIDTSETALLYRGAYIQVRRSETPALPEGQYYVFELVGSTVVTDTGVEVGELRDIITYPANDVFVIDGPKGEILVPALRDVIVHIDREARRIVIQRMPGLIEY